MPYFVYSEEMIWDDAMLSAMLEEAKEVFADNAEQIVQAIQVVCRCFELVDREGIFALEQVIEEDRLTGEEIPLKAFMLNIWRSMLSILEKTEEEQTLYINNSAELAEMAFNQVLVNRYQGCQAFQAYIYYLYLVHNMDFIYGEPCQCYGSQEAMSRLLFQYQALFPVEEQKRYVQHFGQWML